ncbi:glycoside hydrolase family 11 protein [Teredinibacter haidensis]|uniref:glycoside hydrolase family 11 protein n=1 Tax=Teredinibacter haidensis TaxID=2731755 RepID=UPI000948F2F7
MATLVCAAALCAPASSAQTITSNQTGTHNGFYYSFWKDSGDATFGLREDGRYTSQWSNSTNNWVGGKGWNPGGPKVVNYSGSYNVDNSQNSYLALYGWTKSPLIEYYVIESYGSYNPSSCNGGTNYGSFQSDGATYNVRRCQRVQQPSIEGTQTFYQYFSVRSPKKSFGSISGTITVANHFNFWASKGLNLGNHDYMVLATEGYQSSGSSDITVWEGSANSSSSSSSSTSSNSSSSSSATGGSGITVRARGTNGSEHINLIVGGSTVASWTLTTSNQDYTYNGTATGDIQVEFDNDASGLDVILDYVYVNGETRQAEDMEYNTATYDGECGGGSYSETMHCNGVIGFGATSDCFSGNCSSGTTSSSTSNSSSSSSSSSSSTSSSSGSSCQCNWYGSLYPSCQNQTSGWGWENSASCIGTDTCNNQYGDGGVVCN